MKQVTNLAGRMQCLTGGVLLAAAGQKGSSKQVETIADADLARLGNTIHVEDVTLEAQTVKSKASPEVAPEKKETK